MALYGDSQMTIKGKVWCFFEQSGTFKNEFKKLGIDAVDVDIQNNFGQTDHVVDLFSGIETAYGEGHSKVWDSITVTSMRLRIYFGGHLRIVERE